MSPIRNKNTLRALGASNGTRTFSERVLKAALAIPKGKVTTYGAITRACGAGPMASQSITSILGKYENEVKKKTRLPASDAAGNGGQVPWHRIVYAGGKVWIDDKHRKERMALYKKEGIIVEPKTGKIKNFEKILFEYK